MKKKYNVGYTTGVYDLFHIGHLNILKSAKDLCEILIVGVSTDELVMEYKNKKPIIPYLERKSIVESIKYVDMVVPQKNRNKLEAFKEYKFDVMFVGDDWKGSELFEKVEKELIQNGSAIEYFPYTKNISSTMLKKVLESLYSEEMEGR